MPNKVVVHELPFYIYVNEENKLEIVDAISEMIIIGHNHYQINFHFKLFIRITRNIEMMKCV